MNSQTVQRLNAINREFYRVTADSFDETRGQSWPGWERITPHLSLPLSVLDVGCGNGRFGVFLADKLPISYHGLDNNPTLLEHARQSLAPIPKLNFTLEERDIIENPLHEGQYDLVVAFGVLHHIPGDAQREAFVRSLAERVASGGMLAFACWRFYDYERFRARIVAWPDDLQGEVEPHDYLLDWRRRERALRYCHYVDDSEHARLIAATGLTEIETYRADGFTGDVNRYTLLRKS